MGLIMGFLIICFCIGCANVFFLACFGIGKLIWTLLKYVVPILLILLIICYIAGVS